MITKSNEIYTIAFTKRKKIYYNKIKKLQLILGNFRIFISTMYILPDNLLLYSTGDYIPNLRIREIFKNHIQKMATLKLTTKQKKKKKEQKKHIMMNYTKQMKTKCKRKRNLKQKQKQKLTTINTGFNLPYSEHMGIFNTSNRVFNQIQ